MTPFWYLYAKYATMWSSMAQKSARKSIKFRQSLFWDVDPKTIDLERNAKYIIERTLEFGNDDEVRWMWSHYSPELIRDVVDNRRGLRSTVKPLWEALTSKTS